MVETPEMKAKLEAVLENARRLHPLRQARERLALELGNLPFNIAPLQMSGRTLIGEKQRIEGEMVTLREKEQNILQEVRNFFAALVKHATQPVKENMPALISKRLRLRDLLAEAGIVFGEVEGVQIDLARKFDALRKIAAELKSETNESYLLPEMPLPTPLVPSPTVQQAIRMRERGDNIAEILQMMAKQIG